MAGEALPGVLIAFVPHMDAGDRDKWDGPQDERPLSDLGRKQAAALASELERWSGISHLFSSPAARAHGTIAPLAAKLNLEIEMLPSLAERRPGESDTALAQRGERALEEIVRRVSTGIAVAASHGDIVPATVARIATRRRLLRIPQLEKRGQWYSVAIRSDLSVEIELYEIPGL